MLQGDTFSSEAGSLNWGATEGRDGSHWNNSGPYQGAGAPIGVHESLQGYRKFHLLPAIGGGVHLERLCRLERCDSARIEIHIDKATRGKAGAKTLGVANGSVVKLVRNSLVENQSKGQA